MPTNDTLFVEKHAKSDIVKINTKQIQKYKLKIRFYFVGSVFVNPDAITLYL